MTTQAEFDEKRRLAHGMSERAWAVYVDGTRDTDESVAEVIRISVAEELRRLLECLRAGDPAVDEVPGWLRWRADALDSEGAQR